MQRRVFTHGLVRAATAFGLLAAVAPRRALATRVRSTVDTWLGERA